MGLIATVLLVAVLLMAAIWWGQERLIFFPEPLRPDHRFAVPPDVHEVFVEVPGARLNALHLQVPAPRAVVFYLHGNGGNLQGWFGNADFYRALQVDLFMIDYRGYGKSGGRIGSQAELIADVRAAWSSIAGRYAGRPVVFIGRSLGSGLAAELTAGLPPDERPDLLVMVSPYRSLRTLARQFYPWIPPQLLRYPLDTERLLPQLSAGGRPRVLLLHGARDELIPAAHSEALARDLPDAALRLIAGAGHNDLQLFPDYLDALREAIRRLTERGPASGG